MLNQKNRRSEDFCIIPVRITLNDRQEFLNHIRNLGDQYDVTIICLNRDMIAGYSHVKTAMIHALRSWKEEKNIARSLEMEVLLYVAGTRQTGQIAPFGPQIGENFYYLCITPAEKKIITALPDCIQEVDDKDWNIISEEKKKRLIQFFGITPEEITVTGEEQLVDLICECTALLAVNR